MCCDALYCEFEGISAVHIHLHYCRDRFRDMLLYIESSPSVIPVAIEVSFDGCADHMLTTVVVMMLVCAAGAFNPGTLMCCAFYLFAMFNFFVHYIFVGTVIIAGTAMSPHRIAVTNPRGVDVGCYVVNSQPALANSPLGPILVPK